MEALVPNYHFDRGKIFYPLIYNYIAALFGFWELANHGVISLVEKTARAKGISFRDAIAVLRATGAQIEKSFADYEHQISALPPLNLQGIVANPIEIDVQELSLEMANHGVYVSQQWSQSALSLMISSFESCKEMGYTNTDPIWEFLRHCRNASAHGNSFHFLGQEPCRTAEWRGLAIHRSLQGMPLFAGKQTGIPFLKPADPIQLLWDIEQAYPNLNAIAA